MTERGDQLLDRALVERALTRLAQRLQRRGVITDIYVVGVAAMAIAYGNGSAPSPSPSPSPHRPAG